jgi:hypothetical protein
VARMRPRLFGVRAPTQGMRTAVGNKFAQNPLEAAAPHGKYVWTARRHIVPLIIIAAMTANMLFAERVVAYTYLGNCDNRGTTTTWDATWYSTSGTTGVEMRQYQLPSKSSWATCTYAGTGFGHMDELDSLQGTGSQIVQLGIAKYVSSAGTSWLFVWTPSDNSGGIVVDAGGHFGAEPIAGHSYRFWIYSYYVGPYYAWEYCINDLTAATTVCWTDGGGTWHSSTGLVWWGGETADYNDTMGAHPEAATFRTYAVRVKTSSWQPYLTDTQLINDCSASGFNRTIDNCNVSDVGSYPGFFIWNQ